MKRIRLTVQDGIVILVIAAFSVLLFLSARDARPKRGPVQNLVLTDVSDYEYPATDAWNPDPTPAYYTPNGTKYHLSRDCRYLARSASVLTATRGELADLGMEPCSACGQSEEEENSHGENTAGGR